MRWLFPSYGNVSISSCPITVALLTFLLYCLCPPPRFNKSRGGSSHLGRSKGRAPQSFGFFVFIIFFFLQGIMCWNASSKEAGVILERGLNMVIADPLEEGRFFFCSKYKWQDQVKDVIPFFWTIFLIAIIRSPITDMGKDTKLMSGRKKRSYEAFPPILHFVRVR